MGDQIPPQDTHTRNGSCLRIKLEEVRKFYSDWYYVEIGKDSLGITTITEEIKYRTGLK